MPAQPSPKHRVAIIQLHPKPISPARNFARAASYIRAAAAQGAILAVLPEYHLTNWLPRDPAFAPLCIRSWREYLGKYRDLARELGICIVPGTIVRSREGLDEAVALRELEEVAKDGARVASETESHAPATGTGGVSDALHNAESPLQNTAYFIDPMGKVLSSYTKKNLWGPSERAHLSSSARDPHLVFDTPLGRVGLLVCWDLAFPEAFRELIAQGAKIIIVPMFWTLSDASDAGLRHNPSAEALLVDSVATARAFENTCAVLVANAGGPPGKGYMGLSQVAVPFVGPLTRLGSCAEGMSVVDLDMGVVEDAEENYGVRADLARADWHYDYWSGRGEERRSKL